jgi:AbrB family looped-hinge helix DNA binding protein
MKLTAKGQVTIPKFIRDTLGITMHSEVDFIEEAGMVYLVKGKTKKQNRNFNKYRGVSKVKMSTDEIMQLTRI